MADLDFVRDDSIYRNRDALLDDYTPETLVGRDDELQQYHSALQPAIYGEQPNNIFLYGKTGVGKTAATKYLLRHLREDARQYDDIELTVVFLNCDGLTSSYQIATHLVNELRDESNQISTTGYPRATVYEMLWDALDDVGAGAIAFSPLAQGLLTAKYLDGVPDGARATYSESWRETFLDETTLDKVRALNRVANDRGQTLAQMAIAWVLRDRRIASALIGASSVRQLRENVAALDRLAFTDDELATIDRYATDAGIDIWAASHLAG